MAEPTHHGTVVALNGAGVFLRGKPGSGKSSLALRLIDQPGCGITGEALAGALVADDQCHLVARDGQLIASPPQALAGLLEIRGLGIVRVAHLASCPVLMVADLAGEGERLPGFAAERTVLAGLDLPLLHVDATAADSPARIRAALQVVRNPALLRA
jgi:serine kinase of HPr protein (carbohydrate metabolism regulator)